MRSTPSFASRFAEKFSLVLPAAACVAALGSIDACASNGASTTGKRIVLQTKITAGPEATTPFTNSQGWNIKLSRFLISTGPLYYFDGATIFSSNTPRPSPLDRVEQWLGIGIAYAHPGHYIPGNARGQLLSPSSADLFAGAAVLPIGDGVTGVVRSATFSYNTPAVGPSASNLGTRVAILEGTATKGADSRIFRTEIDSTDLLNTKNAAAIEGCPFSETDMQSDGTVTVTIKLSLWFDQVEFDSIPSSADGKPVAIPPSSIAHNELVRGMKAGDGYVFSYSR